MLTMQVPTTVRPWNTQNVRRASVNNFGFGGSNAHVIIDDARGYLSSHSLDGHCRTVDTLLVKSRLIENSISFSEEDQRTRIYVLSAFDESSGVRQAERLSKYLEQQSTHTGNFLDDLAYTLAERRSVFSWRAAIPATSRSQLIDSLSPESIKFTKAPKDVVLGFVFTGQGAQWCGMGRELIATYPVFRDSLVRADKHLKVHGAPWSLLGKFYPYVECWFK
jgi:acyl transferase domain-containing protein